MLKLRAKAGESTGKIKNFLGAAKKEGRLVGNVEMPAPCYFVIEEGDSGYYLFYFDNKDQCFADGWYETLEDTKREALWGFNVQENDWMDMKVM